MDCKKEKEIKWMQKFIRFLMFTAGFYWVRTIIPLIIRIIKAYLL